MQQEFHRSAKQGDALPSLALRAHQQGRSGVRIGQTSALFPARRPAARGDHRSRSRESAADFGSIGTTVIRHRCGAWDSPRALPGSRPIRITLAVGNCWTVAEPKTASSCIAARSRGSC